VEYFARVPPFQDIVALRYPYRCTSISIVTPPPIVWRSWLKPPNRPAGHVVRPANLGKRFLAMIAAVDRLALLVAGQFRLAPHSYADAELHLAGRTGAA
jgi:hypothetical protein